MLALMPQRIFDRKPRLADSSQPVQRRAGDGHRMFILISRQNPVQFIEKIVAALEKGTERGEGKIARLASQVFGQCFCQQIDDGST
jgi:hypothetical protein